MKLEQTKRLKIEDFMSIFINFYKILVTEETVYTLLNRKFSYQGRLDKKAEIYRAVQCVIHSAAIHQQNSVQCSRAQCYRSQTACARSLALRARTPQSKQQLRHTNSKLYYCKLRRRGDTRNPGSRYCLCTWNKLKQV